MAIIFIFFFCKFDMNIDDSSLLMFLYSMWDYVQFQLVMDMSRFLMLAWLYGLQFHILECFFRHVSKALSFGFSPDVRLHSNTEWCFSTLSMLTGHLHLPLGMKWVNFLLQPAWKSHHYCTSSRAKDRASFRLGISSARMCVCACIRVYSVSSCLCMRGRMNDLEWETYRLCACWSETQMSGKETLFFFCSLITFPQE